MLRTLKTLGAAVAGMVMLALPALAAPTFNPEGAWEPGGKDMLYNVYLCGDGTQLCAKLTWLRSDARTAENLAYLNRYVVKGAAPAAANQWQGQVNYAGDSFAGNLTLTGSNSLRLSGCKGNCTTSLSTPRISGATSENFFAIALKISQSVLDS